jgi:hypothetical protein
VERKSHEFRRSHQRIHHIGTVLEGEESNVHGTCGEGHDALQGQVGAIDGDPSVPTIGNMKPAIPGLRDIVDPAELSRPSP